jgi:hypothetical protein
MPPILLQAYTYEWEYKVPGDDPEPFLWRSAMMGAWQIDPTRTDRWTPEQIDLARRAADIYKEWVRPMLRDAKVHHILPRPDGVHWDGMFYWSAPARRGTLYVWRPDSPDASQSIRLKGLEADKNYWLWSEDASVSPGLRRGEDLMRSGVVIQLPQSYSSDVIFLQDEALGKPDGLELPAEFELLKAETQSGMFAASAQLTWAPAEGARNYRVNVAEEPEFHKIVASAVVTQPSAVLRDLPPQQTLYWRVEAMSWGGRRSSAGAAATFVTPPLDRPTGLVLASDIPWATATAGADNPVRRDVNYYGKPLAIRGRVYPKGVWTHAYPDSTPADTVYDVAGKRFEWFKADVGLDDASNGGSVQFQVLVDGELKAESPVLPPRQVHVLRVPIAGARQITLRVLNGGDGYNCDHAVWGAARFVEAGVDDPLDEHR